MSARPSKSQPEKSRPGQRFKSAHLSVRVCHKEQHYIKKARRSPLSYPAVFNGKD